MTFNWEKIITAGLLGIVIGMVQVGICLWFGWSPIAPFLLQWACAVVVVIGLKKTARQMTVEGRILGSDLDV